MQIKKKTVQMVKPIQHVKQFISTEKKTKPKESLEAGKKEQPKSLANAGCARII